MRGVMHQLSDPALRRISTLATAPFFSSTTASQPVSLITRPRKSRRLGLWPTSRMESWRGVLLQHFLKIGEARLGTQRVFLDQLAFVAHFVSHQCRGLRGALERAGDDDVDLHAERGQSAADVSALLDAVFVERALFVFLVAACRGGAGRRWRDARNRETSVGVVSFPIKPSGP